MGPAFIPTRDARDPTVNPADLCRCEPHRLACHDFEKSLFTNRGYLMNLKTKILTSAALTTAAVGLALATPIVKLASPLFSTGTVATAVNAHGVAAIPDNDNDGYFNATLTTDGPSTVAIQDGAYAVGGQNGWHSHPGIVIVTLVSGSIQWFNANCESKIYKAGDSWTEGSQTHAFRVLGTTGVQLTAVFIIAKDLGYRIDRAAPPCAAGLGL
jgi:quercetin dioxygenase-like cupin family protein